MLIRNLQHLRSALLLVLSFVLCLSLFCFTPGFNVYAADESGLCAVGNVDAVNHIATILKADGTVYNADYSGSAPSAGSVYSYTVFDGIFSFSAINYTPGGSGYRVYDSTGSNADFLTVFTGNYILSDSCAVFIRFSATEWSVLTGSTVINIPSYVVSGFNDYPYTVWPCGFEWSTFSDNPMSVESILVDAASSPNATRLFTADNSAMTDGAYSVTPENAVNFKLNASVCAVGYVDTVKKIASVLTKDGSVLNVNYMYDAPKPGTVCRYSTDPDSGRYILTEVNYAAVNAKGWRVYDRDLWGSASHNAFTPDHSTYLYTTDESILFVKFSDTEWSVMSGEDIFNIPSEPVPGLNDYPYTAYPSGIELSRFDKYPAYVESMLIDASTDASPTRFFTPDNSVMELGTFSVVPQNAQNYIKPANICAVGYVNSYKKIATILKSDGTVENVSYTSRTPLVGRIYTYTQNGETYELKEITYDDISAYWRVYDSNGKLNTGGNDYVISYDEQGNSVTKTFASNNVVFVKFNNSSWSVFTGSDVIKLPSSPTPGLNDNPYSAYPCSFYWSSLTGDSNIQSVFVDAEKQPSATRYFTYDNSPLTEGMYSVTPQDAWNFTEDDIVEEPEKTPLHTVLAAEVTLALSNAQKAILAQDSDIIKAADSVSSLLNRLPASYNFIRNSLARLMG